MHPVLFAILSLGAIFFLYQIVAGGIVLLLAGGRITDDNAALIRWTTGIGQLLFILVPTIVLALVRHANLRAFFRLGAPDIRHVLATVVGVFALQQVLSGYMVVQDMIPLPQEVERILDMLKKMFEETYRTLVAAHSPLEFAGVVLVVALIPAISEELLFRGLVQRNMETAFGGWKGALATGLIFGAYHLIPTSFVPLAALGIYFGWIVVRTQSITVAMIAHFMNNFVACLATYLNLNEDFVVLDPSAKPDGLTIAANVGVFLVVFLGATSYLFFVTARRPDRAQAEGSQSNGDR
jgi:uncharacterized protein